METERKVGALQLSARPRGVSPPVTRRLLIIEQSSLAELHATLQIGCSLGDGDHGSVGVSADDGRHDGRIDHSETLDTEDTELRVDDPANPARARRMIEGLRVTFDKGPDVRVAAGCRDEMRGPADRGKSGLQRNIHRELDATDHASPIFFGREKVV